MQQWRATMVAENSSEWIEEEDLATAGQQVVTIIVVLNTLSCMPQKSTELFGTTVLHDAEMPRSNAFGLLADQDLILC